MIDIHSHHIHTHTDRMLTFRLSEKWFSPCDTYPWSTTSSNLVFVNMQSSHPLTRSKNANFTFLLDPMGGLEIILPKTTINLRWIGEEKSIGKSLLPAKWAFANRMLAVECKHTKFLALSTQIIKKEEIRMARVRWGYWALSILTFSIPWWLFYDNSACWFSVIANNNFYGASVGGKLIK